MSDKLSDEELARLEDDCRGVQNSSFIPRVRRALAEIRESRVKLAQWEAIAERGRVAADANAGTKGQAMTLDEALELARSLTAGAQGGKPYALARFVLDTLGTADDDEEAPDVVTDAVTGERSVFYDGITYDRSTALGIAAAIARCALELPEEPR